jgi:hypothetical protein
LRVIVFPYWRRLLRDCVERTGNFRAERFEIHVKDSFLRVDHHIHRAGNSSQVLTNRRAHPALDAIALNGPTHLSSYCNSYARTLGLGSRAQQVKRRKRRRELPAAGLINQLEFGVLAQAMLTGNRHNVGCQLPAASLTAKLPEILPEASS